MFVQKKKKKIYTWTCGKKLKLTLTTTWMNNLEVNTLAPVKPSDDCSPGQRLDLWEIQDQTTQLSPFQIPDQQKLWHTKCSGQLISFEVIC